MCQGMNQEMAQGWKMVQGRKARRARARKRPFKYQIHSLSSR
ncbi:hypothetical protein ID866_10245 [Astraeus odoratus]|nr:hypothetical protein ID866_10245 [Astraeus odoratus]